MADLREHRDEGVLTLTLDRPERRNALNTALLDAIDAALDVALDDDEARVLMFTGTGDRAFCAGADVKELQTLDPESTDAFVRAGQALFDRLANFPKPTLAAVNGFAYGGGIELALACDLRIAADTASFAQPEVKLGSLPGWGGTQRLPRLIGSAAAYRMLYTGDPIDADRALWLGLVDEVTPPDALIERSVDLARTIAAQAPRALRLIKRAVRIGEKDGVEAGLRAELDGVVEATSSEDREELMRFASRSAPTAAPDPENRDKESNP